MMDKFVHYSIAEVDKFVHTFDFIKGDRAK